MLYLVLRRVVRFVRPFHNEEITESELGRNWKQKKQQKKENKEEKAGEEEASFILVILSFFKLLLNSIE